LVVNIDCFVVSEIADHLHKIVTGSALQVQSMKFKKLFKAKINSGAVAVYDPRILALKNLNFSVTINMT